MKHSMRVVRGNVVALLVWCVLLSFFGGQATNINNLKGTYSMFPPELRELSPLEGAIAWHTGLVRRLYDFGHAVKDEPINKPRRDDAEFGDKIKDFNAALDAWKKQIKSSSVRGVVKTFFYREPGTASVADFKVSTLLERAGDQIGVAEAVAKVLSSVWVHHFVKKSIPENVFKTLGYRIQDFDLGSFKVNGFCFEDALHDECLPGYDVTRTSLLAVLWYRCGDNRELLKRYSEKLKEFLNTELEKVKEIINGKKNRVQRLLDDMRAGDADSSSQGELKKRTFKKGLSAEDQKKMYQELLQIYEDLLAACDEKQELIGGISVPDAAWVADAFFDIAVLKDHVKGVALENLYVADERAAANYEKLVCVRFQPETKPDDVPYGYSNFHEQKFADCMDTVMRNVLNHLLFKDGAFSHKFFQEKTGRELHARLIDFYRRYGNPALLTTAEIHNAWADVISDIPWVEYVQRIDGSGNVTRFGHVGYIKVPAEDRTKPLIEFLKEKRYTLVDEETLFELMPTCRNIVMVLDYLLNLNLFEGKNKAEEFARDDFVKEYLPKAFEKFGTVSDMPDDVDAHDFARKMIQFNVALFQTYRISFSIGVRAHGQFESERLQDPSLLVFDQVTRENISLLPSSIGMLLGMDRFLKLLDLDKGRQLLCLFTFPVDNPDVAIKLLNHWKGEVTEYWVSLMALLVGRNVDQNRRLSGSLNLYKQAVRANMGIFFTKAIAVASEGMGSDDGNVRSMALDLWKALFEKGQGFTEAIAAASKGMRSDDGNVRSMALDLWKILVKTLKELVEKGQGFTEAIVVASKGMENQDGGVQVMALDLWAALVEARQGFDKAILAARKGMKNQDNHVQYAALILWKALVEKGQGFTEAIVAASEGMESYDRGVRSRALDLWKALVEKGQGFTEAIAAASKGMDNQDSGVRSMALDLWKALFEKGQGFTEAIAAASKGMRSDDGNVRSRALDLWKALFEKGQGFTEAIVVASKGMESYDRGVRSMALDLWEMLFEKGQGFTEAIVVASKGMENQDRGVRSRALDLWKALFEKGHGFAEAIVLAREGMKNPDNDVQYAALILWAALVEAKQGFDEAILAARKGMENPDNDVQFAALMLWIALVEARQGFAEAIVLAREGMKNPDGDKQFRTLGIWDALFKKGQGFAEARALLGELHGDEKNELEGRLEQNKQFEPKEGAASIHMRTGGVAPAVQPISESRMGVVGAV